MKESDCPNVNSSFCQEYPCRQMHPPTSSIDSARNVNELYEKAYTLWIAHRKNLHNSTNYSPHNGSITYIPSMIGATGRPQFEQFNKYFPCLNHPITHAENRIISRSVEILSNSDDITCSFRVIEEVLMIVEHIKAMEFLLPNVPATKKTAQILVVFIADYESDLIRNLRVNWDQLALINGLQLSMDIVKDRLLGLFDAELMLKRTTSPSAIDFEKLYEERAASVLANSAQSASVANQKDLPISKRSSISEIVFNSTPESNSSEEPILNLNKNLTSMCITPARVRHSDTILGIGPSKQLQSNLFNESEIDDLKPPNLLLATPVHQSKIGRFSVSQSRIFGNSDTESEPTTPIVSNPPSITLNTAQRIFAGEEEDENRVIQSNNQKISKNLQSKVFDSTGSPFFPSLKQANLKNQVIASEEIEFVPSLGGNYDPLKESPLLETQSVHPTSFRKSTMSNVLLQDEETEQLIKEKVKVPIKNRNSSQIQFGTYE